MKTTKVNPSQINLKAGFGFDPDWTIEQAWEAGHDGPQSPFFRWGAWHHLNEHKTRFEKGQKTALLHALHTCALHDLPMPEWMANAYARGHQRWVDYKAASLDEAFEVERPKGKHIGALRKQRKLMFAVPLRVGEMKKKGRATDASLFDDIGKELGESGSTIRNAYYKYKGILDLQKWR